MTHSDLKSFGEARCCFVGGLVCRNSLHVYPIHARVQNSAEGAFRNVRNSHDTFFGRDCYATETVTTTTTATTNDPFSILFRAADAVS